MTNRRDASARLLLLFCGAAALWAALVAVVGGFTFRIAAVAVTSHSPTPAVVLAAICLVVLVVLGRAQASDALVWWWTTVERRGAAVAIAAAAGAVAIGSSWGTHVAGGPDSYCYLSQAELLARGRVREFQPVAASVPWPDRVWTFVPTGHVPAVEPEGASVPMCAAGYPLMMAAARAIGGRPAMFWIVPLMGGLAIWLTFVIGRQLDGAICGLVAAVWLASSPVFLYQIVQPMTDVPAATLWLLAILAALRSRSGESRVRSLVTGIAAGAAVMVRPNLLPLAVVPAVAMLWPEPSTRRAAVTKIVVFGLGVLPFVLTTAALHHAMYGSPFKSGYGDLDALFRLDHIAPNLVRYPVWLLQTETPLVLLGVAAPWGIRGADRRRIVWMLLAFAAATFACYLPYSVFDAWWYLRFVLPAYPPILVLSTAVSVAAVSRFSPATRTLAVALGLGALVVFHIGTSIDRDVFRLQRYERRYRDGGEYVASRLPPDAIILTVWQSGSVRFYSGRQTVIWSAIDPDWLDRSLEFLRAQGYRPYLLFERNEEPEFRKRFERHSRLGGLSWPPISDINREVRIYDPADYDRYMRGEAVWTERIRTR